MLTDSQPRRTAEWNATSHVYPLDRCVPHLVGARAAETPSAAAVVAGHKVLSYAELDGRANHLAHELRALGVGPDVVVGLCVNGSPEMIMGALAILKAGGAYLPLDPAQPAERLAFTLNDARCPLVVTVPCLADRVPSGRRPVVMVDVSGDRKSVV